MGSLLGRFAETWRDAVRDIVLIVLSIIIAFSVDAWWEGLGERRQERDHMEALLTEFEGIRLGLDRQLAVLRRSYAATERILGMTGPSPSGVPADTVARLINDSFDIGVFSSGGGALQALLASGALSIIRGDSLSAALAEWPRLRDDMAANEQLLVLNREEEIQDYLAATGVPISRIAGNLEWLDVPRSQFHFDVAGTLSSATFESMFVSRAVRSRLLEESYLTAQAHVSRTIRLLRSALE